MTPRCQVRDLRPGCRGCAPHAQSALVPACVSLFADERKKEVYFNVAFYSACGAATLILKLANTCGRGEVTPKSHKMPTLFSRFRACAPSRWSGRSHPAPASAPRRSGARRSSARARRAAARSCYPSLGGHAVGKRLSGKWCGREPSAFGAFGRQQGRGPLRGPMRAALCSEAQWGEPGGPPCASTKGARGLRWPVPPVPRRRAFGACCAGEALRAPSATRSSARVAGAWPCREPP